MNLQEFFTAGKVTCICDIDDRVERQEIRQTIRREIANYYLAQFADNIHDYDIEFADYRNQEVINEIAAKWEPELDQYFRTKSYQDFSRTVKAILAYMGVYVVTKYKRQMPVFDITSFIANAVPSTIRSILYLIPSKRKRMQALIDYYHAENDVDTLSQLNDFSVSCKLV